MKYLPIFALLFAVAVATNIKSKDDSDVVIGKRISASVALEAVRKAVEDGVEFMSVDGALVANEPKENPLFRKMKKCNEEKCRQNCNKQQLNGCCVILKCVCWKTKS